MSGDDGTSRRPDASRRSGPRKLAEWVTMAASTLLVLAVAGYLAFDAATQPDAPHLDPHVAVRRDQAQRRGQRWVVPVEITNTGPRTLRKLQAEVTWDGPDGSQQRRRIEVDYLGRDARHTSYIHVERDPAHIRFDARPQGYQLE